ncbi:putative glycine cleavage system T protein [Magnetofaba australis IT-1]|uniref:Aminomethyltransferase n=1 Tax=Magnetofaba australis IT-1 TaxID=1434232 RepID=A0A1Y2K8F0_9PROT|nr:putative glycine cleavage system T protein [Magnetofaba australis IT-1]
MYDLHLQAQAKMVDFAGWEMPINYGSQIAEHHAVRRAVGVFDVSHMAQIQVFGADAEAFLQRVFANNVGRINEIGRALYGVMLNEEGGVIDDLIVYCIEPQRYHVVLNAARYAADMRWLQSWLKDFPDTDLCYRADLCMLAVQGPQALQALTQIQGWDGEQLAELQPFQITPCIGGWAARTGYTGEDGYELMLDEPRALAVWDALMQQGVQPCGLGARDTLRLEAGLNLYGNEMDESVNPLESGLGWTIAWEPEGRDFVGRRALTALREAGIAQKRMGVALETKGVLRGHMEVLDADGQLIGQTTSGAWSPTLERGVAMARVSKSAKAGQACQVVVRGKPLAARLAALPLVKGGQATF